MLPRAEERLKGLSLTQVTVKTSWGQPDHSDEIAQSLGSKNSEKKVTPTSPSLENAAAVGIVAI
jgi:hypothetical protein